MKAAASEFTADTVGGVVARWEDVEETCNPIRLGEYVSEMV